MVAIPCAVADAEQGTDIEQRRLRERWQKPTRPSSQTDAVVLRPKTKLLRQMDDASGVAEAEPAVAAAVAFPFAVADCYFLL